MTIEGRQVLPETPAEERVRQSLQILTTEHFTLQSGRGNTISEANGRVNMFLATLSSVLIAVAFIGQISHFGYAFRLFIVLLLPSVLFIGVVTFVRVIQLTAEDMLYTFGINRIRHRYVEVLPEIQPYFVLSTHDDMHGGLLSLGITSSRWQILFTIPSLVGVLDTTVAGVFLGLGATWFLHWPVAADAGLGLVGAAVALRLHYQHMMRTMAGLYDRVTPLFPTSSD